MTVSATWRHISTDKEAVKAVNADDLKIGDYIRIDHRWIDHPFERRRFRIASEQEIALIREHELTRVFVEPDPATVAESGAAENTSREAGPLAATRAALNSARVRDSEVRERALQTLGVLGAGNQDAAQAVSALVDFLLAILNNSDTPIAPISSTATRNSRARLALQGSDAVWYCALLGKRMGLTKSQLRDLTLAAATHAVGMTRLPPNLPDEEPGALVKGSPLASYPAYSVMVLKQCGGFSTEVLRIVGQHREHPDGSGLPRGLEGDHIHPLALIVGAVRELQVCCAGNHLAPALAMARLYKQLRDTYGATIANNLASAVLVIPVGSYVQLSDGTVARVASINETSRLTPVVECFGMNGDDRVPELIDLAQRPEIFIVRALGTSQLPPKLFATWRNTGPDARPPPLKMPDEAPDQETAEPAAPQASGA